MDYSNICTNCFKIKGATTVCPHCGQIDAPMPEEAYHLNPGTILNARYLIGRVLGFGGFGVTYMSLDLKLSRIVAIKEFFPTSLVSRVPGELAVSIFSGDKAGEYNKGIARFLEEARNMAMFEKNPYIVKVMDVFAENRTAYIVMEYIDGLTLGQLIKNNNGRLPYDEAVDIIKPVLNGLKSLHEKKIYHRDINPKNIMIDKNNHVKIIDFGSAEFYEETEKTLSNVVTGGYAPPEQYRTKSINGAYTDIYSVGATLYKAIVGITPIDATDRQSNDTLQKPSEFIPEIPKNIDIAIMKAMALKHEQRFQTTDEMMNALIVEDGKDNYPEIEEHNKIKKRNTIIISALTAVIAIVVVILLATQKTDSLYKPMKSVILSEETIELYIPYSTTDEKVELETNFNKISKDFVKQSKKNYGIDVTINANYVKDEDYVDEITKSVGTEHEACLFRTDIEEIKDIKLANLENLYVNIKDNMVLSEKYEEQYGSTYTKIPMAFYFYMMYYKNQNEFGIGDINSWSSFIEDVPEGDAIVLSETATPALYASLKDDNANLSTASNVLYRTLENGKLLEEGLEIDFFCTEKRDAYLGTSKDSGKIKNSNYLEYIDTKNIIGCGDNWYGQFDWEWSVSDNVSESKKDVAILFLRYCMSEDVQYDLCSTSSETETILSLNKNVLSSQLDSTLLNILSIEEVENINLISDDSENTKFAEAFSTQGRKDSNTKESITDFSKKYFD